MPSLLLPPQFPPASCRQQLGYQINREAPNGIACCLSSLQPPGLTGRHFRMKMIIAVHCKQPEFPYRLKNQTSFGWGLAWQAFRADGASHLIETGERGCEARPLEWEGTVIRMWLLPRRLLFRFTLPMGVVCSLIQRNQEKERLLKGARG